MCATGLPDFFGTTYQNLKKIPNDHKIYQMATKIPNGSKIDQVAIKYTNLFH
jgi:hypothetical protein